MAAQPELCDLVELRVEGWRGLVPFAAEHPPACVGVEEKREWLSFNDVPVHYRRFRRMTGEVVWLFDRDGEVILVEAYPAAPRSIDPLIAPLGPPERTIEYGLEQFMPRPLARDDEKVDELVWGARGLALLRARAPDGRARLARARGFVPSSGEDYSKRFVYSRPIEFFGP
jgi:hypothetical protein